MTRQVVLGDRRLDLQRVTEGAVQLLQCHHERADVTPDSSGRLRPTRCILTDFQLDSIPEFVLKMKRLVIHNAKKADNTAITFSC